MRKLPSIKFFSACQWPRLDKRILKDSSWSNGKKKLEITLRVYKFFGSGLLITNWNCKIRSRIILIILCRLLISFCVCLFRSRIWKYTSIWMIFIHSFTIKLLQIFGTTLKIFLCIFYNFGLAKFCAGPKATEGWHFDNLFRDKSTAFVRSCNTEFYILKIKETIVQKIT